VVFLGDLHAGELGLKGAAVARSDLPSLPPRQAAPFVSPRTGPERK